MSRHKIESDSVVEADIEAAFDWYEGEQPGLRLEFEEVRSAYERILDGPFKYQDLRSAGQNTRAPGVCRRTDDCRGRLYSLYRTRLWQTTELLLRGTALMRGLTEA